MAKRECQFGAASESQKQIAGPKINLRGNQIEEQKCLKQQPEGLEGGREGGSREHHRISEIAGMVSKLWSANP